MNDPPDMQLADRIEVLSERPEKPFVEVGIIKVRARSKIASSPEKMMSLLKQKAREAGADAIIVQGLTTETVVSGGVYEGKGSISTSNKDVIQALAIAWK
ncbi:MAG: hypothetical protein AB1792_07490 [Candidatus Zixiibacteriota bacterium]